MKIPLKSIYYFECVARHLNYTKAASELFVTHSAVISQVKNLENWLNIKLIYRYGNNLNLTYDGRLFYENITEPFIDIKDAILSLKNKSDEVIYIKTLPSLAHCFIIPRLNIFKSKHPNVKFELAYTNSSKNDRSDFIFDYIDGDLLHNMTYLFSGAQSIVCGYDLYTKEKITNINRDILKYELLHDSDYQAWLDWFNGKDEDIDFMSKVKSGLVFEDFNLMRTAIISGFGIALCPINLITQDVKLNKIKLLSNDVHKRTRKYYVTTNYSSSYIHDLFLEWILSESKKTELIAKNMLKNEGAK